MKKIFALTLAAIVALSLCGCNSSVNDLNETSQNQSETVKALPISYYSDGMYKVGKDIPAGEYWLMAYEDDYSGYYCVSSDSSGDSIIDNDSFDTWTYVTVKDGEYLELARANACLVEDAPDPVFKSELVVEGTYKIGRDLPAGEYKLTATDLQYDAYYAVLDSSYNASDSIVANDSFKNTAYITVKDGQYLQIVRALGEKVD